MFLFNSSIHFDKHIAWHQQAPCATIKLFASHCFNGCCEDSFWKVVLRCSPALTRTLKMTYSLILCTQTPALHKGQYTLLFCLPCIHLNADIDDDCSIVKFANDLCFYVYLWFSTTMTIPFTDRSFHPFVAWFQDTYL